MYRSMWNPEMETMTPDARRKMETEKLGKQLAYVHASSEFYIRKFREAGVDPTGLRAPEELARLPFTTKAELRESQDRCPPFGDFLATTAEKISRIHRTSGTTGKFLFTALTRNDIRQTNECGARAFWPGGLRPHHTVIHCFNYCLWAGGYTDHSSLETTGASVVPFGVRNANQLVRIVKEARVNAISSVPTYPNYLENIVREELRMEPAELGIKLGLFGGEPAMENADFRQRMEATWGMKASNANYGMSEVLSNFASICDEGQVLHFLGNGAVLVQLIDPHSEEDVEIKPGQRGELVVTNLDREAQPLVRYRTRDVLDILATDPCVCGRTGFRFRVIGRSDDMLHVKGINVFPSGVAMVLEKMIPGTNGEFQIVLRHPAPYERLHILVEAGSRSPGEGPEVLCREIEKRIQETLTFKADVELVPPGSIARTEMGKAIRVVRAY